MIQIERHIEILLLENDCVIVPDFGGFVAHYADARYEDMEQMFLPPLRTIGFNPQLTLNDSLLAQSYIEAYDISYPDALERISREVKELRQILDREGAYELHNLGTLSFGDEGQLVFEPCEAGILTPELYGMDGFEMPMLAGGEQKPDGEKRLDRKPEERNRAGIDSNSVTIPLSWLRNTVAAIAAAIAFFFIVTPVANSDRQAERKIVERSAFFPFNMQGHTAEATATSVVAEADRGITDSPEHDLQQAQEAEPGQAEAAAEQTQPAAEQTKLAAEQTKPVGAYTLVLASYVSKKGAADLVQRLAKRGLTEGQVYTYNNITRAIYGSYPDEAEARKALQQLRTNSSDFAESWVLKKRGA